MTKTTRMRRFSNSLLAGALIAVAIAAVGDWPTTQAAERLATAGNPQFDDKHLWPNLSGKECFLDRQWPKGRLYVWAYPGETGNLHRGRRRSPRDPTDPKNWLVDGTLALLDGAFFGKWCNDFGIPDMTVDGGTILGGLPDRPLTLNCTFGLSLKNHTNATFSQLGEEMHRESRRVPSLAMLSGSTIRSHTTDPTKARLVLTYVPDGIGDQSSFDLRPPPGSAAEQKVIDRHPEAAKRFAWFDELPRGLDCLLGTGVVVDKVEFDHLRKGGILYQDTATKAAWKNVFYGPGCLARGNDLFTHVEKLGRNGEY